jgi:hypothetical protein
MKDSIGALLVGLASRDVRPLVSNSEGRYAKLRREAVNAMDVFLRGDRWKEQQFDDD